MTRNAVAVQTRASTTTEPAARGVIRSGQTSTLNGA